MKLTLLAVAATAALFAANAASATTLETTIDVTSPETNKLAEQSTQPVKRIGCANSMKRESESKLRKLRSACEALRCAHGVRDDSSALDQSVLPPGPEAVISGYGILGGRWD